MDCSSELGVIAAGLPTASFAGRGRGGADRSHRAVPSLRRQLRSLGRHALGSVLASLAVLAIGAPEQANAQTPNTPATGAPTITGTAQVGRTLTASPGTITDDDGLTNASYSYQWILVDGTDEEDISGATGAIYILNAAAVGKKIKVRASFTDDAGNAESRTSAPTATVEYGNPPTLSVTVGVGQAVLWWTHTVAGLVVTHNEYRSSPGAVIAPNAMWQRVQTRSGGPSSYYQVVKGLTSDTTHTFQVRAAADDTKGASATVTATPLSQPSCTIDELGDRRLLWQGQLTAGVREISTDGNIETGYGGGGIETGTLTPAAVTFRSTSYSVYPRTYEDFLNIVLREEDINTWYPRDEVVDALRLHVCNTPYDFSSAATPGVLDEFSGYQWNVGSIWPPGIERTLRLSLPANNAATGEPAITGTAQAGQELTADASPIMDTDGVPSSFTYQWVRVDADGMSNPADIADATAATYPLTAADAGKKIKVQVSFTDELSGEETRTSAAYPSSGTITAASTTAPALTSVMVTSTPHKTTDTYGAREHIEFSMTFDAPVTVTGDPTFAFDLGGASTASYYAGSGTVTLRFSHAVTGGTSGDRDTNGISWAQNAIVLNGGTIAGTDNAVAAVLTHVAQSNLAAHKVDGRTTAVTAATVTDVVVTSTPMLMASGSSTADTYGFGETIVITVTVSEAVEVEGDPVFRFSLTNPGSAANNPQATYDRTRSIATTIVFTYTVQAGDMDNNGIWIGTHSQTFSLDANDRIRTASQQIDIDRSHLEKGTQGGHKVDGSLGAPTVPPDPTAPTLVSATATTLTIEWTHPGDGGSPLTRNFIEYRVEGTTDWTNWYRGETPTSVTRTVITNLQAATAYDVRVHATNAIGNSQWVQSATAFSTLAGTASCPVPTFTGRRKIWTAVLTMGDFAQPFPASSYRGYDSTPESGDGGGLDPAPFTLGSRDYEVGRIALGTSGASGLNFVAGQGQGEWWDSTVLALRLHVCNTNFDFSDSSYDYTNEDRIVIHSAHVWATDLDWSGVATRTVHMSLPLNRPATGAPLITGQATVGQELAVDVTGIEDEDGLHDVEYTYQWVRVDADGTSNEADITDATAATYTLTDDDLGKKVKIEVSFPDDFGSDEQRTSAPTDTVTAASTNNAPVFTPSDVSRSIAENPDVAGQNIGDPVTATDADAGDTLGYTLGGDDAASFDIIPSSGQIRTQTNVSYSILDFEAKSTYTVTVTATDTSNATAVATVTISVTDVDEPPSAPATPAVSAVSGSTTSLTVSWAAPANAGKPAIDSYDVQYRAGTSGTWSDGPEDVPGTSTTIASLVADTLYEVQVRATNAEGNSVLWSDPPGSGRTNSTTETVPGVTVSKTALTVTEEDTTGAGYTVVLDSQPTANVTVTVAGHAGTDVTPSPTSLTFTTTTWGTAQTVTVTAGHDADTANDAVTLTHSATSTDSAYDAIAIGGVTVTVEDNDTAPPPPVTGLAQVMGVGVAPGNARLVVNWTAVDTATGYTVQWMSGGEGYNTSDRQATVTSGSTTRYTIPGLINGTEYTVRVIATRTGANDGPPSAGVTGTPRVPPPPPPPVTNLAQVMGVGVVPGNAQLVVTWTAVDTAAGYTVQWMSGGEGYNTSDRQATVTAGSTTRYTIPSLINGTEYTVRVIATRTGANDGPPSAGVTGTPRVPPPPPPPVTNLAQVMGVGVVPGNAQLVVTWTAVDTAAGYTVQWMSGGEGYNTSDRQATVTAGSTTRYTIPSLINGTEYTVRVIATRTGANDGPPSDEMTGTPFTTPGAPQHLSAVAGDAQVTLTWAAPSSDGGSAILRYEVAVDDSGTWIDAGLDLEETVTGLTNGQPYAFAVRAMNAAGTGLAATVTASPVTTPGAPRNLGGAPGDDQVTLTWDAPASDGGSAILRYEVAVDDSGTWIDAGLDLEETVTGLTNGQPYAFAVRAVNAAGTGLAATVTASPVTTPGAPQHLSAVAGYAQVTLTWAAPTSDGGSAILRYEVAVDDSGTWIDAGLDLEETVTGLTNGQPYAFAVRAVNAAGTGLAATVTASPVTTPGAPQHLSAVAGYAQVTLTWDAPTSDGGSAILRYEVAVDDSGTWIDAGLDLEETVTGLTNGQPYAFAVRAVNAAGTGLAATVTASPVTTPGAPQHLSAVAGYAQVTLTWAAPASDGGSAILRYEVAVDDSGTWIDAGLDLEETVTGLTNGQPYAFAVRAVNAAGTGLAATVTASPVTTPGAPQHLSAVAGYAQVTLTWDAPTSDGGSAILRYEVAVDDSGTWIDAGLDLEETVTGLTNGQPYAFAVRAVNAAGTGLAAAVTASPVTTPGAPQHLSAVAGYAQVTLTWDAPSSDGGSAILRYEVAVDDSGTWIDAGLDLEETVLGLTNGQRYTFAVRAVNAAGTGPAAKVTIVTSHPLAQAWLARFGRAATDHVVDAVSNRWQGGPQASHLTIGGVQTGALFGWIGRVGQAARDTADDRRDPVRTEASWARLFAPSGAAGTGGGGTGPGMTVTDRNTGPVGLGGVDRKAGATLSGRAAQGALLGALGLPDPRALTDLRAALLGSSFFYSGARDEDGQTRTPGGFGEWSAWGRGAASWFSGTDSGLSLDGEVVTAMLGFDSRWDRWRAGVVVSHSRGRGTYTHPTAPGGAVASTLTALHPYAGYEFNERTSIWGVLGYGVGEMSLTTERSVTALETGLMNAMAAVGGRTALSVRSGPARRFELAIRSDARLTNTAADGVGVMVGAAGQTHRVRMMLEGSGVMPLATGGVLKPRLEAGLRYDAGDAETGAGLEAGGGLGYAFGRLSLEVNARGLLAHQDTQYEEWGFSGAVAYTPSEDGRGLSLRLGSGWGATDSGVQSLWRRQDASNLVRHAEFDAAQRYQVELRYGLDGLKGRVRWAPYIGVDSGGGSSQALRLGVTLTSGRRFDAGLELGRRQGGPGAGPEYAGQIRATLLW